MGTSVVQSQDQRRARGGFGLRQLLATLLLALLPLGAEAAEYRLAAQDKLRVKVVEWRADKTEYFDWAVLGGEYIVSTSGTVSLPLIGSLPAQGRTTDEFAALIAETLQQRSGAVNRPEASVEIVQYRPIYVVGAVERPGEYPYRPGLTVLQAVGIAGGIYRQVEPGLVRLERDQITATGTHESARLEIRRLLARRARLAAELSEDPQIGIPDQLRNDPDIARLIADEAAIMNARIDALRSKLTATSELKNLFAREVESLEQKIVAHNRQIELARQELKNVSTLVGKGLAVSSREFALERTVVELENKMLDYTTAALRARQEIGKSERDATDLRTERKASIVAEIQETEAALDQAKARMVTAQKLIEEATTVAPRLVLDRSLQLTPRLAFWIVRQGTGDTSKIAADENAAVNPGDVVHVEAVTGDNLSGGKLGLTTASERPTERSQLGAN
ncbi:polysaccharide biosynthesis/export family protein [Microvirga massiliensis]|uniref:polysaccharide biosynthesis/export family protein n=1 Tax=Microvirga massiliensis TaxID=1033741 RepID=UPI0009E3AE45|nr:polysaccharide biosynthesis/export family protein [Microvirga massiliensis]